MEILNITSTTFDSVSIIWIIIPLVTDSHQKNTRISSFMLNFLFSRGNVSFPRVVSQGNVIVLYLSLGLRFPLSRDPKNQSQCRFADVDLVILARSDVLFSSGS